MKPLPSRPRPIELLGLCFSVGEGTGSNRRFFLPINTESSPAFIISCLLVLAILTPVKWCLIVILICISLMITVFSTLLCTCWSLTYLCKHLFNYVLCPFLNWGFGFVYLAGFSLFAITCTFSHIFDSSHLLDTWFAISPSFCRLPCHFADCNFCCADVF